MIVVVFEKNAKELMNALASVPKKKKKFHAFEDINHSEMAVFGALMRLSEEQGDNRMISMSDISEEIDISRPALSQVVNKLEDKMLVERIFSKEDRRITYLSFTKEGETIYRREREKFVLMANTLVKEMGEKDTEELIRIMHKLSTIMDQFHCTKCHKHQGEDN